MVTIIDVARRAGVSPSTVSHVLNGKRPISDETKQLVLRTIHELGYEPNPNAQALRGAAAVIIGFLASDLTEVFSTLIIQGVEKVAINHDAYILFASGVEFNNNLDAALTFLQKRRIDGLLVSFGVRRKLTYEHFKRIKIPVVTINANAGDDIPSVEPDDYHAGAEALHHLRSRGALNPCMIAGPKDRLASDERIAGFMDALREIENHSEATTRVVYGDFSVDSGKDGLKALLRQHPDMDGLFCANDFMAAGAIEMAAQCSRAVPDQLKIVGFDNREFGSFWPIPISTFELPLLEMGRKSAELLFDMIGGHTPSEMHHFLASRFIARKSC